jgi:hypothetical protein
MHDTSHEGPDLSFMIRSVSNVSLPHRSSAGSIRTSFSVRMMITGLSEIPFTISPSQPVLFSAVPNLPPASLSPNMPVRGDLDVI